MRSSYLKRQTPITQRMAEDMLVRNLAVRTIYPSEYRRMDGWIFVFAVAKS